MIDRPLANINGRQESDQHRLVTPENTENEHNGETDPDFVLPPPPIVAGPLLQGEPLSFFEFVKHPCCAGYLINADRVFATDRRTTSAPAPA
jgi:hypothetical protein